MTNSEQYGSGVTPLKSDTMRMLMVKELIATNTGGGGGTAGGTGAPTSTPTSQYALYIQTDSVPPGQIWEWYSGSWH